MRNSSFGVSRPGPRPHLGHFLLCDLGCAASLSLNWLPWLKAEKGDSAFLFELIEASVRFHILPLAGGWADADMVLVSRPPIQCRHRSGTDSQAIYSVVLPPLPSKLLVPARSRPI